MKYLIGIIVGLMLLVPAAMGSKCLDSDKSAQMPMDLDASGMITQNEMNAGLVNWSKYSYPNQ